MTEFNNSSNPILVQNYRGGIVESFHRGSFCVVDENGKVLWSVGDIQQRSFPRSALKYFQHIPFLLSGGFDDLGTLDEARGPLRAQGSALTRNVARFQRSAVHEWKLVHAS